MATSDNSHSNPISRAFAKFFERGDVSRKHEDAAPAPRQVVPQQAAARTAAAAPSAAATPAARTATAAPSTPANAVSAQAMPAAAPSTVAPGAAAVSTQAAAQPRTYTVRAGDSLSKIAQQVYGRADLWPRIFEANRDTVRDANLIHPGQVLVIPDATTLH